MLTHLGVQNFALIESLQQDFQGGISIFTGETGAGKSILMDAFSVLLGARASAEYVRHGAKAFVLHGVFDIADYEGLKALLAEKNLVCEGDELLISRSFTKEGKANILVNDQPTTLKTLREIGGFLADIHGQFMNQDFLKVETHHRYLDTYTTEAKEAYRTYGEDYGAYKAAKKAYEDSLASQAERAREIDMLTYQIEEIGAVNPKPKEDEEVSAELERMDNFEALHEGASGAYEALRGDDSALLDVLARVRSDIEGLVSLDSSLGELSETLNSAYYQLEEVAGDLDSYRDAMYYDEERHAFLQERDSQLYELKRKYGQTVEAVIAYGQEAQERLDSLTDSKESVDALAKALEVAEAKARKSLNHLQAVRRKNNEAIGPLMAQRLQALGMAQGRLSFSIVDSEELTALGAASIELLFSANAGEDMLPLQKVASGGEISRIALAFTTIFAEEKQRTIVFDEIDVGISGDVAVQVAKQIQMLGVDKQVFCITHLPQTACIGNQHFHIHKEEVDGRTVSKLRSLSDEEHIETIGQMMSGQNISTKAVEAARDLIAHFKK